MKNLKLIILFLLIIQFIKAQNADQLIRVNNVADNNAMNSIPSPTEGSLVYVNSSDEIYFFGNGSWNLIQSFSASGDNNDDAWGVTGEDIISDISRTGKVKIGSTGNTSTKLDVNGRMFIRHLPISYFSGTQLLHTSDGEISLDQYTTSNSGSLMLLGWEDLCSAVNGATVTGFYSSQTYCSIGHFQFRYRKNVSPPFIMMYHVANQYPASFTYNSSTGIYTAAVQMPCGTEKVEFRVSNNMLQKRFVETSPQNYITFSIRLEGY